MTSRFDGAGHWLVVANGARARVLEQTPRPGVYRHVADLVHPQTREREHGHERFAREVAALLNAGVAAGECLSLVLVASEAALGAIQSQLSARAARRLRRTLAGDYTALRDAELAQRLAEHERQAR